MPETQKGLCRKVNGENGRESVVGKAARDERALKPSRVFDWQMRRGSDAISDAASGEGMT